MMEDFLDLAYQKRFRIIKIIFNAKGHQIHQKKLIQKLDISLPTLTHKLTLIQEDLVTFACQDQLVIHFDSTEKNYFLKLKTDFSLDLLLLYYLEDSLKFQLVQAMMTDSLLSVNSISSTWFTTPSSLRREIHSLRKLLLPWQLKIKTTHTKIRLVGEESVIRLFYAFFFLHSYGAYKWIFRTITYREITRLLQLVPDEILEKNP
ncbi:MAG: helix-turn-helix domain-containing protein [Enterococcus lacertideformus]|uniref:Helix-turn-helix domain-containing protein n=1 Tax=Enterococcus lacertideformus TaxID=2771493 RepID=A0A931FBE0_9ENTE|nr:helix-turn-helix domain-containing protein [Enterococcus lacertideformus]